MTENPLLEKMLQTRAVVNTQCILGKTWQEAGSDASVGLSVLFTVIKFFLQ